MKTLSEFQINWILSNIHEDYLLEKQIYESSTGKKIIMSDYEDEEEFIKMVKEMKNAR